MIRVKVGQLKFFADFLPVFLKFLFLTRTYVIPEGSQNLHIFAWILRKTWNMLPDVDKFDETNSEKTGQKIFIPTKRWPFLKKISDDYLTLTDMILYLIICTINVKRPRGPFNNLFWGLSYSVMEEEKSYFFHWNVCPFVFFFRTFCFQELIRSLRIDVLTCTKFAWILCGAW